MRLKVDVALGDEWYASIRVTKAARRVRPAEKDEICCGGERGREVGGLAVASGGRQASSATVPQGSVDLGANLGAYLGQSRRGSTSNSVMRIDRSEST